jgi:hypothetical protein
VAPARTTRTLSTNAVPSAPVGISGLITRPSDRALGQNFAHEKSRGAVTGTAAFLITQLAKELRSPTLVYQSHTRARSPQ